jgi:hypothetical protein
VQYNSLEGLADCYLQQLLEKRSENSYSYSSSPLSQSDSYTSSIEISLSDM